MNYYNEIKNELIKNEVYDQVKDYTKDRHKVSVYFEVGKLLSKAGKEYGKNIIKQYAEKLMVEVGKKYNYRTLYRMRKFYERYLSMLISSKFFKKTSNLYSAVFDLPVPIGSV